MKRIIPVGILVGLCLLILAGCSGGGSNPALPAAGSDPDLVLTSGSDDQARKVQQATPYLIGYYDVLLDVENQEFELVPNRSIDFALNLMFFLNTPTGLSFNVNDVISTPDFVDIDIDITLNHPIDDAMFDIYDVRAIFIGDGTEAMSYDSDLIYGGAGTHQGLLNADGYSRWFNPTGFDGGTLFDYVPNFLSTPGYTASATLNPYKYYGEGLGAADDLWSYLTVGDPQSGYFLHGAGLTRNFLLRFPIPVPGFNYAFAIIANWEGTEPGNHPSHAYEAVGVNLVDNSNLYYVNETDNGGNLDMDIIIFDWDAELTGNVMLDYDLYIESSVLYSDYKVNPSAMVPTASGDHWNTFHVEIPADIVLSTAGNELWVIVEDNLADYTNPAGFPNEADDDPLAACFRFPLGVATENPVPWIEVTSPDGGESWPVYSNQVIIWVTSETGGTVRLDYSKDNFFADIHEIVGSTANDGSFMWNEVPDDISDTVRVRISSTDPVMTDISDDNFSISEPGTYLRLLSPNGGEQWGINTNREIVWESSGVTGDVNLFYSKDDFVSDINEIEFGVPVLSTYIWEDIPDDLSDTVLVKVETVTDPPGINDISNDYLSIYLGGWGETWGGELNDWPNDMIVDTTGNIHIAGSTGVTGYNNQAYYTVFSPSGEINLNYIWGGTEFDSAALLAMDDIGNVYIAGNFDGTDVDFDPGDGELLLTSDNTDAFLSKFAPDGSFVWAINWGTGGYVSATALVVTASGIIVGGSFSGFDVDFDPDEFDTDPHSVIGTEWSRSDCFIAKFDLNGDYQSTMTWGGTMEDQVKDLGLDSNNRMIVCGSFRSTDIDFDPDPVGSFPASTNGQFDFFISIYDETGDFVNAVTWGGPSFDMFAGLGISSDDRYYFLGDFTGSNVDFDPGAGEDFKTPTFNQDAFLACYDSNLDYQWALTWGCSGSVTAGGISLDLLGNVYATGCYLGDMIDLDPGTGINIFVNKGEDDGYWSKFDPDGNYITSNTWGGPGYEGGYNIFVDPAYCVYVAGDFEEPYTSLAPVDAPCNELPDYRECNGNYDSFLIKYMPDGCW